MLNMCHRPFVPTWYQQGSTPCVLDLVWVHDWVLEATCFNCFYVFSGALVDHLWISMRFSASGVAPQFQQQWYIPRDSVAEWAFLEGIASVTSPLGALAQSMADALALVVDHVWDAHARQLKEGSNPTQWWTNTCQVAKELYEAVSVPGHQVCFMMDYQGSQVCFLRGEAWR